MVLRYLCVVCVTTGSHVCTSVNTLVHVVCVLMKHTHTHTHTHTHSFNASASVVCGRWRRFTCACLSIAETRLVCVRASATHTLNKGTEMLHNVQWLTRSRMSAHHTALSMPTPPITKTRSPWTTADMRQHGLGSDGPLCQVCVPPSNT